MAALATLQATFTRLHGVQQPCGVRSPIDCISANSHLTDSHNLAFVAGLMGADSSKPLLFANPDMTSAVL